MSNAARLITFFVILLLGCQSTNGRYQLAEDRAPLFVPKQMRVLDAEPKYLPYYPPSLRQYTVFGVSYQPLKSALHYADEGKASWYGKKFHGHLTSSGEPYNMFEMTAAHKFLPLPSFVRVLNLDNQQSVIVKVNDRGPFHGDRIIDLSYAAAHKIGILKQGTGNVRITSIVVDKYGTQHENGKGSPSPPLLTAANSKQSQIKPRINAANAAVIAPQFFIQVLASSEPNGVINIGTVMSKLFQIGFDTKLANGLHKLQLGPIPKESAALLLLQQVRQYGYKKAFLVRPQKLE